MILPDFRPLQKNICLFHKHLPLKHLEIPTLGKNVALNQALDIARGKLFVFTDDDVIPETCWLRELFDARQRWPDDSIFCGTIIPLFPKNAPKWLLKPKLKINILAFVQFDPPEPEGPVGGAPFGGNVAISAKLLASTRFSEDIGPRARGTDWVMGSETELLFRLKQRGHRFIYIPTAKVLHVIRQEQLTLGWLFGRAYRFGRSKVRLNPPDLLNDVINAPRIFRVPRYIWRKYAASMGRFALSMFQGERERSLAGIELYKLRGIIYEYRRMR